MLTKLFAALLTGVLSLGIIFPQLLPTQNAAAPTSEPQATQAQLTAQQAQSIALDHTGLKSDQVTRLRTEKDRDDGVWVFDVEFCHGGFEYEYEIHAQTGKILSFEKDD